MLTLYISCLFVYFLGSTFCQTDIRRPPTITIQPRANILFRQDESVTLKCKAEGNPPINTYEWKKDDFELNLNLPNIGRGMDGTITISNAAKLEEGFYQCFARNQFGTALSNTAHMQLLILDSTSGTPTTLHKTVTEGMPFHIQADPRRSFPKPIFGWEMAKDTVDKNPVPLRASRRIQIAENGDLHFAYALRDDAPDDKIFKCTTYNPHLDIKAGGSYTNLTVTKGALNPFPPTLGFASETETVVVIGGSVTLRCFFSGNPEPAITWTGPKDKLPIARLTRSNFDTELTINHIIPNDEGEYKCTASNTEGNNEHVLKIRVEAKPRFIRNHGPRDVNVTEGESAIFNCTAFATPEATIVWYQNGKQLDPNNPLRRFVFSKDSKILTIRDVCRDCDDRESDQSHSDLTVIQCNASNVHGYAFGQGYLNVLEKTEVTIHEATEVIVDVHKAGQVVFDCRATTDPSTPPTFQWYKVEVEDHTKGDQLLYTDPPFITVDAGLLSIHVAANATDKWPNYLGQYRCIVDNVHSKVNQTANISAAPVPAAVVPSMCGTLLSLEICWFWVIVAAAVLGLFIILVIICCAVCNRHSGEKYNVDKKERWTGKDPVKEFFDDGFEEYQRQECKTPTMLSTRPSFSSTTLLRINEEDSSCFNEYMGDEGRFTEDGSFIGGTYRSQSRMQ